VAANTQTKPVDLGYESAVIGSYHPHPPSPLLLLQYTARNLILILPSHGLRKAESHRHCSKGAQPVPSAAYRSGCRDKHRPRCDSNLVPVTSQPDVLTTRQGSIYERTLCVCLQADCSPPTVYFAKKGRLAYDDLNRASFIAEKSVDDK